MPDPMTRPRVVVHADWSTDPIKRWMAVATFRAGRYEMEGPQPVGDATTLVDRTRRLAQDGGALLGFDFPIGLPEAYASRAGVTHFPTALRDFGSGRWSRFYDVAEGPSEIAVERPFYPARPGGTSQDQLASALGVASLRELRRRCEQPTAVRGAACVLFWTLGGNQVGRGAISGWRSVIGPSVRAGSRLWPFDGSLATLLRESDCTLAETYPAQACVQLGLPAPGRGWSKRIQADRGRHGIALERWALRSGVDLNTNLLVALKDGFGGAATGEDAFDATVGLMGMLDVVLGHTKDGCPNDPAVRTVEGWILGA